MKAVASTLVGCIQRNPEARMRAREAGALGGLTGGMEQASPASSRVKVPARGQVEQLAEFFKLSAPKRFEQPSARTRQS